MREVEVVISHLVMDAASELRAPARSLPPTLHLRVEPAAMAPEVAAHCYRVIGGPWHWVDRLPWSADQWAAAIHTPGVEVLTLRDADEAIVAYAELATRDGSTEIRYFGVAPAHLGQGIGGPFLAAVVAHAWRAHPARVVLNTCSLDGPAALPNYLARGFRLDREERTLRQVPT